MTTPYFVTLNGTQCSEESLTLLTPLAESAKRDPSTALGVTSKVEMDGCVQELGYGS